MTHTPLTWYPFEGGEEFPRECTIFIQNRFREMDIISSAAMLLRGARATVDLARREFRFMIIPDYEWEQDNE